MLLLICVQRNFYTESFLIIRISILFFFSSHKMDLPRYRDTVLLTIFATCGSLTMEKGENEKREKTLTKRKRKNVTKAYDVRILSSARLRRCGASVLYGFPPMYNTRFGLSYHSHRITQLESCQHQFFISIGKHERFL